MGLLDILDSDQGRLGVGLLAAAGPSMTPMGFGQRLQQGFGYVKSMKDADLERKLTQAKLDDVANQATLRNMQAQQLQRQQEFMSKLFEQPAPQSQTVGGELTAPTLGGVPMYSQGAGLTPTQTITQPAQDKLAGVDRQAAMLDYITNGGKNIGAWVNDRTKRDMTVSNGYAFDKNHVQPGFLPQLNTSQNGQTSMVQIGPDGLPVVSAPTGALPTYAGYRNLDESAKANFDPVTITPQGQNPQITTRGALVRNPAVNGTKISSAEQAALDADRVPILKAEIGRAQKEYQNAMLKGDQSAAARAQSDIAALNRELGNKSATVGMPLQSDEEKQRAAKGVETDSNENVARAKDIKTAQKFQAVAAEAEKLLKAGPTNSGIGSAVDSTASFFGHATKGAVVSEQLKSLGGWLVSNVPRMEGPQSNFDVANYQTMAANVANDKLPVAMRLASLKGIQGMMQEMVDGGGVMKPKAVAPEGTWAEQPGKKSAVSNGWSATLRK